VLLPLPGPGWVIIFFGLGVLASEFAWARRLLAYARRQVGSWTGWVRRQGRAIRVRLGVVMLLVLLGVGAAYVSWRGLPAWLPGVG